MKITLAHSIAGLLIASTFAPASAANWGSLQCSPRLSVNESTNASLAAADGEIFLRTEKSLWCFANAPAK